MTTDDIHIYTRTMARIYAEQGHLEKSAQIYRHLLEQSPEQQGLQDELQQVLSRISEGEQQNNADLVRLFDKWIEAMGAMNRLKKLKEMQKRLTSLSRSGRSASSDTFNPPEKN